jgi:hypothetical protein
MGRWRGPQLPRSDDPRYCRGRGAKRRRGRAPRRPLAAARLRAGPGAGVERERIRRPGDADHRRGAAPGCARAPGHGRDHSASRARFDLPCSVARPLAAVIVPSPCGKRPTRASPPLDDDRMAARVTLPGSTTWTSPTACGRFSGR